MLVLISGIIDDIIIGVLRFSTQMAGEMLPTLIVDLRINILDDLCSLNHCLLLHLNFNLYHGAKNGFAVTSTFGKPVMDLLSVQ